MNIEETKSIIEAILFAAGRPVEIKEFISALEIVEEDITKIMENMRAEYEEQARGIELIRIEDSYQLCSKPKYHEYIYQILDKRMKPNLSNAALEVLAIIAYNPKITRAEIESIRGVNSDASLYKLLEYNLIENAGKSDAPGRPTIYRTNSEFLKLFGISNLEELPELPRYKIDENEQIVLEEVVNDEEQEN